MDKDTTALLTRTRDRRLTVIAKRTYSIAQGKIATRHPEQQPLTREPQWNDAGCLEHDADIMVTKNATDVVVKGAAHAPEGRAVEELEAAVAVADQEMKRVTVIGDRRCEWREGRPHFSRPEPFTSMPITYDRAYGGSDESAREELDTHHFSELQPYVQYDLSNINLCVYYRNSKGLGYVIHEDERMDGVALPNIEDSRDRLTASRLAVKDPYKWYYQPLSAGFDWYDYSWFPRLAYIGMTSELGPWDELPKPSDPPIVEIQRGYMPRDYLVKRPMEESISMRMLNGASPGLIVPTLAGDEKITLTNMDPLHREFSFGLPGKKPRVVVKPVGEEPRELQSTLFSVIIEKEANRMCLVWGASTFTKYPYGQEQLDKVKYRVLDDS